MVELFNKGENKVLEFKLDIEGVEPQELDVRMLIKFNDYARTLVFYAVLKESNTFQFNIPPFPEVKNDTGTMILEVISDDMYFKTWEDSFTIKVKKEVKVGSVNFETTEPSEEEQPNKKVSIGANLVEPVQESKKPEPKKEKKQEVKKEEVVEDKKPEPKKIEKKETKKKEVEKPTTKKPKKEVKETKKEKVLSESKNDDKSEDELIKHFSDFFKN